MHMPATAIAIALALALSGCRADEQGRQISLDKGSYQGKKDTPLTGEQRHELRERTLLGH